MVILRITEARTGREHRLPMTRARAERVVDVCLAACWPDYEFAIEPTEGSPCNS
jgi:hypothetical protein